MDLALPHHVLAAVELERGDDAREPSQLRLSGLGLGLRLGLGLELGLGLWLGLELVSSELCLCER